MIRIIDAPCGAGKTSWAIQMMNEEQDQHFVYCSPFLSELERIKTKVPSRRFKEPEHYVLSEEGALISSTKKESFDWLLFLKEDIAVTHSTFLNATEETESLICAGEYTLILDEALDVIQEFNGLSVIKDNPEQLVKKRDVKHLLDDGTISIDRDTRKVSWTGKTWTEGKFSELEQLVKMGRVYYVRDSLLVSVFPPEMFKAFKEVVVMTYLLEGTLMKYYLDSFSLEYVKNSVVLGDDGAYRLVPYDRSYDAAFRDKCSKLISIHGKGERYPASSLSKKWYDTHSKGEGNELAKLKGSLSYFFKDVAKAKASENEIMWTCPKEYRARLEGKGYRVVRQMTKEEKNLPERKRRQLEQSLSCFVPCNARATNDFSDRWALAYCLNYYPKPVITGFFDNQQKAPKIEMDMISLAMLIQWIFRSRIRNGESIVLFLPSQRMEKLLCDWLAGKDLR